jgi:hypothetical protein
MVSAEEDVTDPMLPGQEAIQQIENARAIVVLSALAILFYWRAVATAVGVLALLEMVHG